MYAVGYIQVVECRAGWFDSWSEPPRTRPQLSVIPSASITSTVRDSHIEQINFSFNYAI